MLTLLEKLAAVHKRELPKEKYEVKLEPKRLTIIERE